MTVKKMSVFWIIGIFVSLYAAFAFQNLWNWFVVTAFQVSSISFWGMYGLILLVDLLKDHSAQDLVDNQRFKGLHATLDACVPEEKRTEVEEKLDELIEFNWIDAVSLVFGRLAGITITLVIGWVVHMVLA